ncbi:MAG: hypothetical protein E8D45_11725 [Nitrospira sp.]|nr:MAG: hypothetical protein E8D45_11725 [Nitrospira sp.]
MTQHTDQQLRKVERALAEAYRARPDPVFGADWTRHVMRDIRREDGERKQPVWSLGIDRLVWRAASIGVMLAVILAGSAMFDTGQDEGMDAAPASDELEFVASLIE